MLYVFIYDHAAPASPDRPAMAASSYGTTHKNPDFAAVTRACGSHGVRVEKPRQPAGALKDAYRHKGPALVDIVTDPSALSIPPKTRAEMVTGFALSASKIVLDRRCGTDAAARPLQPAQRATALGRWEGAAGGPSADEGRPRWSGGGHQGGRGQAVAVRWRTVGRGGQSVAGTHWRSPLSEPYQ